MYVHAVEHYRAVGARGYDVFTFIAGGMRLSATAADAISHSISRDGPGELTLTTR